MEEDDLVVVTDAEAVDVVLGRPKPFFFFDKTTCIIYKRVYTPITRFVTSRERRFHHRISLLTKVSRHQREKCNDRYQK